MHLAEKTPTKDILIFPSICDSYAIRNTMQGDSFSSVWSIFGWGGHRIGTYIKPPTSIGHLFLPSAHDGFDSEIEMCDIESSVSYAWLMAMQTLSNPKSLNKNKKEFFSKKGFITSKYGIRAFSGGVRDDSVCTLFNSKDQFVGDIILEHKEIYLGRKVGFKNHLDIMPFSGRNKESVLSTLMYCCGF
jgi:hypothetical protein